ncbi:MAG TPA: PEP-CTERM sorting domain-containing protein [Thermoanaerobaculaceae bacterium]|nr:PEP-CTERM sorting domain-containing protein [Thermoanaerobaculaceae bacterium]
MRARLLSGSLLVAAVLVGMAGSASATPVVYNFLTGTVHLTGTIGASSVLNTTINLNGTQVTFDTSPLNLPSFQFTTGAVGPLALTGVATGEFLSLSSLSVVPDVTYGLLAPITGSNPYNFAVGKVDATATSVVGTGLVNFGPTTVTGVNAALSGLITLGGGGQLNLNGITIGPFNTPVGNMTLKADVTFLGIVPEPGTALLVGSGLIAVAANRRRAHA